VALTSAWWHAQIHPDDLPGHERALAEHLDAGSSVWRTTYRIRHADGSWRTVEDTAQVIRDSGGRAVQLVGAIVDVTARAVAAERQRASEERYRHLFEANPHPMWVFDVETLQFLAVNEAAISHYGYSREEFGRMTIIDLRLPDDVPTLRVRLGATPEGLQRHGIRQHRKQDGSLIDVEVTSCGLTFAGRPARLVLAQDVTEQQRAERALQEASRRKDEFLAMLAHELRNPLAPIRYATQMLQMIGAQDPRIGRARDVIDRQVDHLVRLVDDLLDVSRVSRGKIELRRSRIELAAILRQAVETSRPLVDARRHALHLTLPDEPVYVDGDTTRLTQVVSNLLNNAAKYTDAGGHLELSLEAVAGEAVIRVRDDGRGLDPAALEHVFEPFFQVDRNLDRSEGGLGIGLSLVKDLVELHGGRVEARSAGRGRGSEFVVRLARVPSAAAGATTADEAAPCRHRLRILVVDDNLDAAEGLVELLQLDGHETLMASDGEQAVHVALQERPDVVLLDIGLPKLDGRGACRAMRDGGLTQALIVAMTGYGQDEDRRASASAGFDAHQIKPVKLSTIRRLLAGREPHAPRQG
jgi:PAS domain S-box-containing protein